MFACPHCQFENPLQNRFCQRCGNPLRGLRAIITRAQHSLPTPREQVAGAAESSSAADILASSGERETTPPPLTLADLLTADTYLDEERRYQLRHPDKKDQPLAEEVEIEVVDCQPAIPSPIALMLESDAAEAGAVPADLSDLETILPPLAYPYWALQEQFFPVLPELQAAWHHRGHTILILEDRSTWRLLSEAWGSAEAEPLELIHWLYEMVDLWSHLLPFEAEPSLLSHPNLVIDDDQILCLKRLLYRPGDRTYDLKDLGLLWQSLLQSSTAEHLESLKTLVIDIARGQVAEGVEIKDRLAQIADALQGEVADTDSPDLTRAQPADEIELPETSAAEDGGDADALPLLTDEELLMAAPLKEEEDDQDSPEENISDLPTMALPMQLYRLEEAGQTHVGRQRDHNEDSFYAETDLQRVDSPTGTALKARGLYILCDGMGGHAGGEVASMLAVNTLKDYFATHWQGDLPDEETIKTGIWQANQAIYEKNEAEGRSGNARMGTTLVMVLLSDNHVVVAHVGDSRLYFYTRQGLKQITTDHEVGQREIDRGVEPAIAYARPDAYQLTQALGPRGDNQVVPHITNLYINQDTVILLCSDGLSDNDLIESHIETHIDPLMRSRVDLDDGVANLIDLANEHNGHDNITAIAVRVKVRPNLEAIKE